MKAKLLFLGCYFLYALAAASAVCSIGLPVPWWLAPAFFAAAQLVAWYQRQIKQEGGV